MKRIINLFMIFLIVTVIFSEIAFAGAGVEIGDITVTTEKSKYTLSEINTAGGAVKIIASVKDINGNILTPNNGMSVMFQVSYNEPPLDANVVNPMPFDVSGSKYDGNFVAYGLLPFPDPSNAETGTYYVKVKASIGSFINYKTASFKVINDDEHPKRKILIDYNKKSSKITIVTKNIPDDLYHFIAIDYKYPGDQSWSALYGDRVGTGKKVFTIGTVTNPVLRVYALNKPVEIRVAALNGPIPFISQTLKIKR